MIDNLEPKPNMWETNPKLKMLSLVFIFVFLFSGIALVIFSVWSNQYRQKIYEETQSSLPKHEAGVSENQKVGISDTSNWKTYKNDQYGFEFQYPATWQFESSTTSSSTVISIYKSSTYNISVAVISMMPFENIEQTFFRINGIKLENMAEKTPQIVDGKEAIYYKSIPGNYPYNALVFKNQDKLYEVVNSVSDEIFKLFTQTFKFTNLQKAVQKCEDYNFGNCPSGCVPVCLPSKCSPNGPCTEDCNGPGSCVSSK